jgi:hypothetical protein
MIKIRAYCLVKKRWMNFYELPFMTTPTNRLTLSHPEVDFQLFTGLKDKNGVEIYKGDIVKMDNKFFRVFFEGGAFGIRNIDFSVSVSFFSMLRGDEKFLERVEVVGNIYYTPELLKEE